MLLWLLMLQLGAALGNRTCRNYPTKVFPGLFREGEWLDQVRVYPGPGEYVSDKHPKETVSMFLANFNSNCGYFELVISKPHEFDLVKGYFVRRFSERFYTFKVTIGLNYGYLDSDMFLDRSQCEHFGHLNESIGKIDILETDYSSFMIIHQCINGLDYLMLLTARKRYMLSEKHEIEAMLIDVMEKYGIEIENRMFSWVETTFCDRLVRSTFPAFYSKKYIDRNQTRCPKNLPFEMMELKHYWKNKIENAEKKAAVRKTITIRCVVMVVGFAAIVGLVAINLDNIDI
jgi:hypothetical protein